MAISSQALRYYILSDTCKAIRKEHLFGFSFFLRYRCLHLLFSSLFLQQASHMLRFQCLYLHMVYASHSMSMAGHYTLFYKIHPELLIQPNVWHIKCRDPHYRCLHGGCQWRSHFPPQGCTTRPTHCEAETPCHEGGSFQTHWRPSGRRIRPRRMIYTTHRDWSPLAPSTFRSRTDEASVCPSIKLLNPFQTEIRSRQSTSLQGMYVTLLYNFFVS